MDDPSSDICDLFHTVLQQEMTKFLVDEETIRQQIGIMKEVYLPNKDWKKDIVSRGVDYNDPAARCAYVHKYAMCYTGMVNFLLTSATSNCAALQYLNEKEDLDICSLGGGPGTDVVGILNVFTNFFDCLFYHATVIDYIKQWEKMFNSVIKELGSGKYGDLSDTVSQEDFTYEYMQANLFNINMNVNSPVNMNVTHAIARSDFLSMIKFISAAACDLTERMVNEVFNTMKSGAIMLFIDNAAGGFLQTCQREAKKCGMTSIYGPLEHFEYEDTAFSVKRFGYTSQSRTKVSMQMWMKNFSQALSNQHTLLTGQTYLDNEPLILKVNDRVSNPRKRRNRKRKEVFKSTNCGAILDNAVNGFLLKGENQCDMISTDGLLEHNKNEEVTMDLRMKNCSQELSGQQDSLTEKMSQLVINDIDNMYLIPSFSSRSKNRSKLKNQLRKVKIQANNLNQKRQVKKQPNNLNQRRQVKKQPNNLNQKRHIKKQPNYLNRPRQVKKQPKPNDLNRSNSYHSKHNSSKTNQPCTQNRPSISVSIKRPLNKRKQPYRTRNVKTKQRKVKRNKLNLFRTNRRSKRESQSICCCCTII